LAFIGAGIRVWTGVLVGILVAFTLSRLESPAVLAAWWAVVAPPLVILNSAPLRRRLLSAPVLKLVRRKLPELSRTEREALEAGEVWWEAELLRGRPDWQKLSRFPLPPLSEEEQAFLDGPVEELCQRLDDFKITRKLKDLPPEVWQFLKQNRFFGLVLPRQYGGLGFSARAHSEIVLKIASRSLAAGVTVMVPNSLGPGELILKYGTSEQKDYYLPRLARGEEIPCFALTSSEAGSDASAMTDNGIICQREFKSEKVLGILLNWDKRYITLAPVATLLGLAFKLYDPDHLLGEEEDLGITLALVPADTPGVEIGARHNPLDIPFQNGPTRGHDVFIPLDWVVGGRAGVGQGWRMLMECLAEGRGVSLPALASAAAKLACRTTFAYTRIRRQFELPLSAFEGVVEALGKIGGLSYLIEAGRILTLAAIDQGIRPAVASAILKYHTTEAMRLVVNAAMDVHGGKAIMQGPNNHLGNLYHAIPISITVEGANILTRCMIIYGQGAIRCHPYLLAEMQAASSSDLVSFDRALLGHLGLALQNLVRAVILGLSFGYLARVPAGPHRRYLQHLTRFSAVLAFLSDLSLGLLGGELKRRERLSARLGDILSYLYLASALLRYHLEAEAREAERPLFEWGMAWCLSRIEQTVDELLANYPWPSLGRLMKRLILPWGKRFSPPRDFLDQAIVTLLQTPGSVRDRLTAGMFLPKDSNEPVARLEQALAQVLAASASEGKLRRAIKAGQVKPGPSAIIEALQKGLLLPAEAECLHKAQALVREVIAVDADEVRDQLWR
jgi:acyl-CoA dehydrogenase